MIALFWFRALVWRSVSNPQLVHPLMDGRLRLEVRFFQVRQMVISPMMVHGFTRPMLSAALTDVRKGAIN